MNILAVLPILHEEVVVQMRVRLNTKTVPPNTFKGLRYRIDTGVRSRLDEEAPTPRPVHAIYNLVELLVLRLSYELLLVEGAGPSMGAELRLSSQ